VFSGGFFIVQTTRGRNFAVFKIASCGYSSGNCHIVM